MIFSRHQMDALTAHISIYYDKALLINFEEDTFLPIKVSDREWDYIDKNIKFSEWIKGFIDSEMSYGAEDLIILTDKEKMVKQTSPLVFDYMKKVIGSFHSVQTELYPIGSSLAYLVVRDLTKMQDPRMEV